MSAAINAGIASVTEAVKSAIYTKPREPEDWLDWRQAEQPVEDEERKMCVSKLACSYEPRSRMLNVLARGFSGEICDVIRRVIDRNVEGG